MSNNISTAWPMPQPKSRTRTPGCKGFPSHSRKRRCPSIARHCPSQVTTVSLLSKHGSSIRLGTSLTTPEPSVPQKPLACQSAKFGIDVLKPDCPNALSQARPQRASTITRADLLPVSSLSLASVRGYTTSPGDSPRNVRSVLSTCGVQLSLLSAPRPV